MIKVGKDQFIVFLGSMNAMPMMYALELRARGYTVLYFVDAPSKDKLSRPEHHFSEITYPYPSWIKEIRIPSQVLIALFPKIYSYYLLRKIRAVYNVHQACFMLNGFFVSLSPHLKCSTEIIAVSHGSDLDTWADKRNAEQLAKSFCKRSIFKFMPAWVARRLIKKAVLNQYAGYLDASAVLYFPKGFNQRGDNIIKGLNSAGVQYFPRYDISIRQFNEVSRDYKPGNSKLVLTSLARFIYKTFPDNNEGYNKGNDVIIKGIAEYYKRNNNIEVVFFEKGEDVSHAKKLCQDLGISHIVNWHREVSFREFVERILSSDICFDQVGTHWIGAGIYALWLGKPLIANAFTAVNSGVWPSDNPVCNANSLSDICEWLVKLENEDFRKSISERSKIFAQSYTSPISVLEALFEKV